jgi:hypothetical protein
MTHRSNPNDDGRKDGVRPTGETGESESRRNLTPAIKVPAWISAELIQETRDTWQSYFDRPLTDEDVVRIATRVAMLMDAVGGEH